MNKKNILFVGAHHDDVEIACGGTALKFSKENFDTYHLVFTDSGFKNENNKVMRKSKTALEEAVKAKKILEFKKLINFNLKTNKIKFTDAVKKKFLRILNELKPEYLFVHSEKDANSDHRIISASVTNLSKRVPNILHYKSNFFHTKNLFNPNYFVNISKEFNKKIIAVKKYRGELKRNNNKWIKLIEKNNFLSGDLMGCKYAEAFEVVRLSKF